MTCGTAEENYANNVLMRDHLAATGLRRRRGARCGRATPGPAGATLLDPHLTELLRKVWQLMDTAQWELDAPGLDRPGTVIRYGHWGRPVLVFPSEQGRAWDYENNGMVGAVSDLVDAGRVKLYCVDSFDDLTWSDRGLPLEERAGRHRAYESWITDRVVPLIGEDSPGASDVLVTGCSLGAYHALQLALTRADLFPVAICQSGNYDPSAVARLGRARRGGVLHQPHRLRRPPARRPPRLAAQPAPRRAGRGRGAWETAPDRLAARRPRDGRAARRHGDPARARRVGPRLRPRLAVVAPPDRPPPAAFC